MDIITTAHKGATASQDAPERPGKGKTRGKVRDASQATGKRRKARVVIGGGTGSTQRPLDPLTARFASRISKAFSRTMNPVPSAARVRHANCLTLPECLTLRPKMAPGLDVRRFSCLTLMPYYSPVNRGLIERVRQLDTEEAEQEKRGLVGGYIDACLTRLTRLTLSKSEPNSPARPAHQKSPPPRTQAHTPPPPDPHPSATQPPDPPDAHPATTLF